MSARFKSQRHERIKYKWYYMKEELLTFWQQANKDEVAKLIKEWIAKAESSGIGILKTFAKTIEMHKNAILACCDYQISTGSLECFNNKIKRMKRQAYGFRDMEFFKLKIKALHQANYALVG